MDGIDPNKPVFQIYASGRCVALMFDPRFEDMFWCSYRIEPVDQAGDLVIHDPQTWQLVAFAVKDMDGRETKPKTFSGGYQDFCNRHTDRLTFRSLWPRRPISLWLRRLVSILSPRSSLLPPDP